MRKPGAPRFVCEIEVQTTPHDRRVLRSRMEAARQLYNAVLDDLLWRLDAARRDPGWAEAREMPRKTKFDRTARSAAFLAVRCRYGLSEFSAHKHPSLGRKCWIREHLDANTAQKAATEAWRAVEENMYGTRRRPRFRRRGELRSVEGKKHDVGIRLIGWEAEAPAVAWDGLHGKLRL
ncbi:MAG: transposase, partial [Actinomycetota bacterium]|nr:transposase [Actinomycetota bacterium]